MPSLAIGIRYLTGYAVASDSTDRQRPEWPPHPARVFMALTAAHFESGGEQQTPEDREGLEWLEAHPAPAVFASEADVREPVVAYVPVNDQAVGKNPGPLQCIQGWPRSKQPRRFLKARPQHDTVYLFWPDADLNDSCRAALEHLCSKTTRIGHSSSLVQVWVDNTAPYDSALQEWHPAKIDAEVHLRVPTSGLLSRLESAYQLGHRPTIGAWHGYRRTSAPSETTAPGAVWDPRLLVRRLVPENTRYRHLGLVSSLQITQRLHEAVLAKAGDAPPEFISGHCADGSPSEQAHLAYFPLAYVGSEHATGRLMGLAIALPGGLSRRQRFEALAAVGQVESLMLGPLGVWRLATEDLAKANLRPEVWTAQPEGALQWATVTPLSFDRHAKATDRAGRHEELAEMVRQCCHRIGLPTPAHVIITPVSPHLGVPAAHEFPRLRRKDGSERRHAHAIVVFDEPVRGPVALGAGRYRGYGLLRPFAAGEGIR